jgi:hypothetical protein
LALVVDDDGGRVLVVPVVAELDFLVAQIDGGFIASAEELKVLSFLTFLAASA